jgi:hypothetical protein
MIKKIRFLFIIAPHAAEQPHPETSENSATKAQRHEGFIYNKTFCVPLCLSVFVAIFMVVHHDGVRRRPETNENVGPRSL